MVFKLGLQGCRHGGGQLRAGGQQDRGCQGVVLGLGQQVGGHLIGPGAVVGDHQHLTGPCQRIDCHAAVDRFFGQGHVEVAGAADHVDPGNGGGTEGQGPDRLGAPNPINLLDPGQVGRRQHGFMGLAAGAWGRHHHEPLHPGYPRRHSIHQHGAGVRSPPPRHV